MHALKARDHLIVARDHGIPVPALHHSAGREEQVLTIHLTCPETQTPPIALEQLPMNFTIVGCSDCLAADGIFHLDDAYEDVDRVIDLAYTCGEAVELTAALTLGRDRPRPLRFQNQESEAAFMSDYLSVGYTLARREHLDGRSQLEHDTEARLGDRTPEQAPLQSHCIDLAADATRMWLRVQEHKPVTTYLSGQDDAPGKPLVRVVRDQRHNRGFDTRGSDAHDGALRMEAASIHAANGWELIHWNSNLNQWAGPDGDLPAAHGIADSGGVPALVLEQAFLLYSRQPQLDGPSLQDYIVALTQAAA